MLAAAIWVFLPYISTQVFQGGLESSISALCLSWLIYLLVERREGAASFRQWGVIGLSAGLTILARLDNIFVVLLLGIWFVMGRGTAYLRTIAVGDLGSIFIVGLLSYFVGLRTGWSSLENAAHAFWLIGAGLAVAPPVFFLFGLYTHQGDPLTWRLLGRAALANLTAAAVATLILFAVTRGGARPAFPTGAVLLVNWAGILLAMLALRLVARTIFPAGKAASVDLPSVRSWAFWKPAGARAAGYYLPVVVLLGGYLTLNLLYAGTAMPVSGQIKQWWGALYANLYGSVLNRGLSEVLGNDAWGLAMLPIRSIQEAIRLRFDSAVVPALVKAGAAIGLLVLLAVQRKWVTSLLDRLALFALFVGLYAQIFNYTAAAYWHIRDWYWVSEMFFAVLFAGVLLECVRRTLQGLKWIQKHWAIAMAILGAACVFSFAQMLWRRFPYALPEGEQFAFLNEVRRLEANTEPGSLIGVSGGGVLGYFIQGRTIVNLDGLINSNDYFESMKSGDGAAFLDEMGLDYVLTAEDWLGLKPYRDIFTGRVERLEMPGLYRFIRSGN